MTRFVDEAIAVDVSDLHLGQENFPTHLHSWWLIHQCQKGGPGQLVMGQRLPGGWELWGLPLVWPSGGQQPGPVPPPWPGPGQRGALGADPALGMGNVPGDGILIGQHMGPWVGPAQGPLGQAGLWGAGDWPCWGIAGAGADGPWGAEMRFWALGRVRRTVRYPQGPWTLVLSKSKSTQKDQVLPSLKSFR